MKLFKTPNSKEIIPIPESRLSVSRALVYTTLRR